MKYLIATDDGPRSVNVIGTTHIEIHDGVHAGWRLEAFVWFRGYCVAVSEMVTGLRLADLPIRAATGTLEDMINGLTDEQYYQFCDRTIQMGADIAFQPLQGADTDVIEKYRRRIDEMPPLNHPRSNPLH